jgi:hypothetical protein
MIIPLVDLPADDRALEVPPVLLSHEYIDGDNWIAIKTYVAIHIYEANPLRFNLRMQSKEAGPIVGEWW